MDTTADFGALVGRVQELGPFPDAAAAGRCVLATLQALARFLTEDERAELARALPAELRHFAPATRGWSAAKANDFYLWVAVAEGIPVKRAVEHAQIVCRALGERLPDGVISRLLRNLPEIGGLFSPPSAEPALDAAPPEPVQHDLAEGHAGGRRPLADANPARLAHRHSVARNADPHADSRLSSAHGLTQEREGQSLAGGEPGSRRPLSRSH